MSTRELDGAVVAVIGAGGGLGAPIVRHLAARGARLVLAGPHPDRIEPVADAVVVALDLRDSTAGDTLVAEVLERHGRLDGFVNAAGVVAFGPLVDTDDVVIEELFLTNVVGPLWMLRRVIPLLSASKGFVVNLSAVLAEQPLPGMVAYGATKAALTSVDVALARELRRAGVQVCDVRPPHTETGLAARPLGGVAPRLPDGLDPEAVARRVVEAIERAEAEVASEDFST